MTDVLVYNGVPIVEGVGLPTQAEMDAMNEATFQAMRDARDRLEMEKAEVSAWLAGLPDFEMRERTLALVDMVYYD